jgi:hypothetical protein
LFNKNYANTRENQKSKQKEEEENCTSGGGGGGLLDLVRWRRDLERIMNKNHY